MRNTDERTIAVKLRIKEIEQKKRARQGHIIGILSIAASLLIIVCLSFSISNIMAKKLDNEYKYVGTAASTFIESDIFGYVIIGLLAFTLGICVTILCYRIHLKSKDEKENNDD